MLYSNGEFIYLLGKQCQILSQYAENSFKIVIHATFIGALIFNDGG